MTLTPITFLLVDDDEDDRELFEFALGGINHPVTYTSVESCCAAIDLLNEGKIKPDYIFLDLNMPVMNGRECLKNLKKNAELAHIPVVIFTTSSDPNDITECLSLGAVDFISKPAKTSELATILTHFLASPNHHSTIKN